MEKLTYTVPEAGEMLGIGRNQAYQAARSGDLPVIEIGRRKLVPRAALMRKLEMAGREKERASE